MNGEHSDTAAKVLSTLLGLLLAFSLSTSLLLPLKQSLLLPLKQLLGLLLFMTTPSALSRPICCCCCFCFCGGDESGGGGGGTGVGSMPTLVRSATAAPGTTCDAAMLAHVAALAELCALVT